MKVKFQSNIGRQIDRKIERLGRKMVLKYRGKSFDNEKDVIWKYIELGKEVIWTKIDLYELFKNEPKDIEMKKIFNDMNNPNYCNKEGAKLGLVIYELKKRSFSEISTIQDRCENEEMFKDFKLIIIADNYANECYAVNTECYLMTNDGKTVERLSY